MRFFLIPLCFYFVASTWIQLNDPDWKIWFALYLYPTLLCLWATFLPASFSKIRVCFSELGWFLLLCVAASAQNLETWFKIAANQNIRLIQEISQNETLREQIGLILSAMLLLWTCKFSTSFLHCCLKFCVGCLLCTALLIAPKICNFNGDHCGGISSKSLPSIFAQT